MDIVERLQRFNAKERYWLLHSALGPAELAAPFLQALCDAAEVHPPPPATWWAIDYHLDWLACALAGDIALGAPQPPPVQGWTLGTQEDVDLIVAWSASGSTHLLMVEAKGYTPNSNRQLSSKAAKLHLLFGDDGHRVEGVKPHFILASPTEPRRLNTADLPSWCLSADGRPRWVELAMPGDSVQPVRCDENARRTKMGDYWTLMMR